MWCILPTPKVQVEKASGKTRLLFGLMAMVVTSCGHADSNRRSPAKTASDLPLFGGTETEYWLARQTEPVGRDDILLAFEQSARSYGCATEHLGEESSMNIHGERRSYYGVSASCAEGTIALITLAGGSVSIGCAKPTTPEACDLLLRNISESP